MPHMKTVLGGRILLLATEDENEHYEMMVKGDGERATQASFITLSPRDIKNLRAMLFEASE